MPDTTAWLWIGAYSLNLFLNVFLFVRLPKSDLLAIQSWFSFTIVLLLLRVLCVDFMELSNYELYPYIIINGKLLSNKLTFIETKQRVIPRCSLYIRITHCNGNSLC